MHSMRNNGRGMAGPRQAPVLGRILAGVGLVTLVAKVLKAGRRHAMRRAAWHAAYSRFTSQPLPIDQPTGPAQGFGGPVHRVAVR